MYFMDGVFFYKTRKLASLTSEHQINKRYSLFALTHHTVVLKVARTLPGTKIDIFIDLIALKNSIIKSMHEHQNVHKAAKNLLTMA